jgi:hypothetical protein
MKKFLVVAALIALLLVPTAQAQEPAPLYHWQSLPYGTQTTCGAVGGVEVWTQYHNHVFRDTNGVRPDYIFFYLTGPHTHTAQGSGYESPHYDVVSIFPEWANWVVQPDPISGYEGPHENWVYARVTDDLWPEGSTTAVNVGYQIEVHGLKQGQYTAPHYMAAQYGPGSLPGDWVGSSVYNCLYDWFPYDTYIPVILK